MGILKTNPIDSQMTENGYASLVVGIVQRFFRFFDLLNSLKEKTVIIKMVENGSEQARIFTAKLISKVGFFCSSLSSKVFTALICANGQKLQALWGKTTNNKMSAGVSAGRRKIAIDERQKVIPARLVKRDKMTPNSPNLIRTAIPMKSNTKGVIKIFNF